MKSILTSLFVLSWAASVAQNEHPRVLFIGNSYTGSNNLPEIFENFCAAAGDTTYVEGNSPGGTTLQFHDNNQQTNDIIEEGDWDYVVLQEQSQLPSFPISQVQTQCFPYAESLNSKIEAANPCGETVFFMTWGRENGDAGNCATWPPVCTYEGMDSLLYERYMQMAEDNDAIVSPVGALWRYIRDNFTFIDLYTQDESHPSAEGSYAAACAFYAVIHRKDPENVPYDFNINALAALQIRYAAKVVVFDSLEKWKVGNYDTASTPSASFTSNQSGLNASFFNTSTNATTYFWDFGDGTTSAEQHPSHEYPGVGNFTVELIAQNCDSADTVYSSLIFDVSPPDTTDTTTGILNISKGASLFPNPAQDQITIRSNAGKIGSYTIYDNAGRILLHNNSQEESMIVIDISAISDGVYILNTQINSRDSWLRFVKN